MYFARQNGKKFKPAYAGVMLLQPEQLTGWWEKHVGPLGPQLYAHHSTLVMTPTVEDLYALPLGELVTLRVIGYLDRGGLQAAVVRLPPNLKSNKRVPHVTVSTDGVRAPRESDALLEQGWNPLWGPELSGRVGYSISTRDVFDLTE